jgi:hypothetical protein
MIDVKEIISCQLIGLFFLDLIGAPCENPGDQLEKE